MLNDIENPKFASRYQIASGLCGPIQRANRLRSTVSLTFVHIYTALYSPLLKPNLKYDECMSGRKLNSEFAQKNAANLLTIKTARPAEIRSKPSCRNV